MRSTSRSRSMSGYWIAAVVKIEGTGHSPSLPGSTGGLKNNREQFEQKSNSDRKKKKDWQSKNRLLF